MIFISIWFLGFLINIPWEFLHSRLYLTSRNQTWRENTPLLIAMSFKDGFFISLFYAILSFSFGVSDITRAHIALILFIFLALAFSFFDERVSIKKKRWEYAPEMPLVFGVGVTPFVEIAATGIAAFFILFRIFLV